MLLISYIHKKLNMLGMSILFFRITCDKQASRVVENI